MKGDKKINFLVLVLFLVCASGCGGFSARRMAQAPNTYPKWLAPVAPVTIEFSDKLLTALTNQYLQVRSPDARIRYRVLEPADYKFSWTNRLYASDGKQKLDFSFNATIGNPHRRTNQWTTNPRGTVFLVHGYGVSGFAMLPWAFLLAQEG